MKKLSRFKILIKSLITFLVIGLSQQIAITEFNQASGQSTSPPNIVLIVIDDIGYGDLGIYGNKLHKTPNMDRLAVEGMIFTDFHTNGAVCSPTRAALMTGQYQQRSGVEHAIGFVKDEGMPLEKKTFAEMLSEAGYVNGIFGKWHLGHVELFGPNFQGFHESYVSNNTPDFHTHISRTGEYDWFKNHEVVHESGYLTHLVTEHSVNFIIENKNQPFFLYIPHVAVHFPFQGPDDPPHRTEGNNYHGTSRFGPLPESQYRRAYKEMLEEVDLSVGEVITALDELGLRGNTFIFVTSDNGAYHWNGYNYPFRGQKGDLFEGGHRVPAIANWPGKIQNGSISHEITMLMDLAPTIITIAGLGQPEEETFDGVDLSPVLFEEKGLEPRYLYWRFNNPYTNTASYAVRDESWKYIVHEDQKFLFNLNLDITESNNMINHFPKQASKLEKAYKEWLADIEPDEAVALEHVKNTFNKWKQGKEKRGND
jgi:arylsulfatase A